MAPTLANTEGMRMEASPEPKSAIQTCNST